MELLSENWYWIVFALVVVMIIMRTARGTASQPSAISSDGNSDRIDLADVLELARKSALYFSRLKALRLGGRYPTRWNGAEPIIGRGSGVPFLFFFWPERHGKTGLLICDLDSSSGRGEMVVSNHGLVSVAHWNPHQPTPGDREDLTGASAKRALELLTLIDGRCTAGHERQR